MGKQKKITHFHLHKVWIKQDVDQNLHVFLSNLYKNDEKCYVSSKTFYSTLNLVGMFWKMGKFEI